MRAAMLLVLSNVFVVNLAAFAFLIILILFMSSFWWGSKTVLEYSRRGLTNAMWAVCLIRRVDARVS